MKPFDLERAKAGDPVYDTVLREIVHFVGVSADGDFVVDSSLNSSCAFWKRQAHRLAMAPMKRTLWVNLYPNVYSQCYDTEEEADEKQWDNPKRIGDKAYPIEIEE